MTGIVIHITPTEIITSTVIYGIVHGIWSLIKWGLRQSGNEARYLLREHNKNNRRPNVKHYSQGKCAAPVHFFEVQ